MKKPSGAVIRNTLILAVTILIFFFLFTKIDFFSVLKVLRASDPSWLLLSLLPLVLSLLIRVKRWQKIIYVIGGFIPFVECLKVLVASFPLASVTPWKSGDLIRAYYLKDRIPPTKTIGAVIAERILDLLVLISSSLIGMVFCQKYEFASIIFVVLLVLIGLIFILHINVRLPIKRAWNERLQDIASVIKTLTENKNTLSILFLYSLLNWILAMTQTLFYFYAVGVDVPILFILAHIPLTEFISMIPITLGGMGTRDAAIIVLFSEFGSPEKLLGVGVLFSIFRYWLWLLIGIPFMRKMVKQSAEITG